VFHPQQDRPDAPSGTDAPRSGLTGIVLDAPLQAVIDAATTRDGAQAIAALIEDADIRPHGVDTAFTLHIARHGRDDITLESRGQGGVVLHACTVPGGPLRQPLRDYALMVEGFQDALRDANPMRIQAIDAGRRMLHTQGAETLSQSLAGQIALSAHSARNLFTLFFSLTRNPK